MATPDLTEVEMVEILKEIARDGGNAAARIAAIRELRVISGAGGQMIGEEKVDRLDELNARRAKRRGVSAAAS